MQVKIIQPKNQTESPIIWDVLKTIKKFTKTHTLRWLFYRKPNFSLEVKNSKYTYKNVCSICRHGSNYRIYIGDTPYCSRCNSKYIEIPNKNIGHALYLLFKIINFKIEPLLDWLHILRKSGIERYSPFSGDENYLIEYFIYNTEEKDFKIIFNKRKWYEYLIIKK